jgi:ElaB/YqjD/DUF883 family membrane-anchored ribosome-binding protein
MLGTFGYSRGAPVDMGEIERRLRALERRLERAGGRASASAAQTADQVSELIASALSSTADRFRGGADAMSSAVSDEAARLGNEAAKLGNDALRRVSKEVANRPLVTLAVAVGVGLLIGLSSHRR